VQPALEKARQLREAEEAKNTTKPKTAKTTEENKTTSKKINWGFGVTKTTTQTTGNEYIKSSRSE
jgi:hypothetical protein